MTKIPAFDFGEELTELVCKTMGPKASAEAEARMVSVVIENMARQLASYIGMFGGGDPARVDRLLEGVVEYLYEAAGPSHKVMLGVNDGSIRTVWVPNKDRNNSED
jgi:hypothetical protein